MDKKKPMRLEFKISILVVIAILIIITIFIRVTVTYSKLMIEKFVVDMSKPIGKFIDNQIDKDVFVNINNSSDINNNLYIKTNLQLINISKTFNITNLYLIKYNKNHDIVYIVGGIKSDEKGFYEPGNLISNTNFFYIDKVLSNNNSNTEKNINESSKSIFGTYWPVFDEEHLLPIGAIAIEMDMEGFYKKVNYMEIKFYIIGISFAIGFFFITIFIFRKTSEPYFKRLALTDGLTGLKNRMAFELELKKYKNKEKSINKINCVMIDINFLKEINDTLGHDQGDNYICETAKHLSKVFKNYCKIYRVGGDEIALISEKLTKVGLKTKLDEILNMKMSTVDKSDIKFNFSYGITSYDKDLDSNIFDTFKRADNLMYQMKSELKINGYNL